AVGGAPDDRTHRTDHLRPAPLRQAQLWLGPSRDPGMALGAVYEDEEAVLRHFFVAGKLPEIPAKHAKRLIVLSRLSLEFEPGVRYREADVNAPLKRYHADYASLRRTLVDA